MRWRKSNLICRGLKPLLFIGVKYFLRLFLSLFYFSFFRRARLRDLLWDLQGIAKHFSPLSGANKLA